MPKSRSHRESMERARIAVQQSEDSMARQSMREFADTAAEHRVNRTRFRLNPTASTAERLVESGGRRQRALRRSQRDLEQLKKN